MYLSTHYTRDNIIVMAQGSVSIVPGVVLVLCPGYKVL